MPDSDILGPIDYLAVEFPNGRLTGSGLRLVRELVRQGVLLVLDLEFVRKEGDGSLTRLAVQDIPQDDPLDMADWSGSYSGLLDDGDLRAVGDAMSPGSLAGIIVYEQVWAARVIQDIEDGGARLLGSARIQADDLLEVLGSVAMPEGQLS